MSWRRVHGLLIHCNMLTGDLSQPASCSETCSTDSCTSLAVVSQALRRVHKAVSTSCACMGNPPPTVSTSAQIALANTTPHSDLRIPDIKGKFTASCSDVNGQESVGPCTSSCDAVPVKSCSNQGAADTNHDCGGRMLHQKETTAVRCCTATHQDASVTAACAQWMQLGSMCPSTCILSDERAIEVQVSDLTCLRSAINGQPAIICPRHAFPVKERNFQPVMQQLLGDGHGVAVMESLSATEHLACRPTKLG
jgi:hypothetical protein